MIDIIDEVITVESGIYMWPCGCKGVYDEKKEVVTKLCLGHSLLVDTESELLYSTYDLMDKALLSFDSARYFGNYNQL